MHPMRFGDEDFFKILELMKQKYQKKQERQLYHCCITQHKNPTVLVLEKSVVIETNY